ncbi:hypothetical protein SAMN02982919_02307 [Giesbergeria anulus]|uniref:Uncharacterized protein n=1 Tax=Giesbergeria anulus TaxID=180197 RepID=A0A1H9NRI4_9BURK|nr:hypothetical protein SAMN02982919_02307 [Giesbergeria anulus]
MLPQELPDKPKVMNWKTWTEELCCTSQQAVADLLRGAARIHLYERLPPHGIPVGRAAS